MDLLKFNQTKFLASHVLLWVAVWFFYIYFFSYNSTDSLYVTWFSSILMPLTMATTYTTAYYLIPHYLLSKKYFLFGIYSIYTLIFTAFLVIIMMFGSLMFLSNFNVTKMPPMSRNFVFILILVYLVRGLVSFVHILSINFKTLSQNNKLQNKILDTQLQIKAQELDYLKKQIHPHFLFNALNTIYGFSLKKSEHTPEIILKLSNLLDYILYQVKENKVSLHQEICHIEEYISLEQIRFQDTLEINLNYGEIPEAVTVPPMLFLPFVENAFKHGNIVNGKLKINMDFKIKNNAILFQIKNTITSDAHIEEHSGIGLETITKRLQLLFPENYLLETKTSIGWYNVQLKMNNV